MRFSAGCYLYRPWEATVVGAIGGAIACLMMPLWDRMRIDDPVGATSVHGQSRNRSIRTHPRKSQMYRIRPRRPVCFVVFALRRNINSIQFNLFLLQQVKICQSTSKRSPITVYQNAVILFQSQLI
jgi:Ammonium Transporter Family